MLRSFLVSLFASIFTSVILYRVILATKIKIVNRGKYCKNILLMVKSHSKYCCFLLPNTVMLGGRARAEPDGTRADNSFRLSPKRTSPFKSAGESVQSTAGSRGLRISVSNAGYTTSRGRVRVLATHSTRQFPLHFPSRASPCATTFRKQYTAIP